MSWPIWLGDLPTWITAAAIGTGAASYFLDRDRRREEKAREESAQAVQLSAWTVTDVTSEPRTYGVVIDNRSNSTFHGIEIHVQLHREPTSRPIELSTLPPGRYWVAYNGPHEKYVWDFPIEVGEYEGGYLRPYTKTEGYKVERMEFLDSSGMRWSRDEKAALRRKS